MTAITLGAHILQQWVADSVCLVTTVTHAEVMLMSDFYFKEIKRVEFCLLLFIYKWCFIVLFLFPSNF